MLDSQNLTKQETVYMKVELCITTVALPGDLSCTWSKQKTTLIELKLAHCSIFLIDGTGYTLAIIMVFRKLSYCLTVS